MKHWFETHEWARRALRTFFQTAVGVLAAAVVESAGVLEAMNLEAVVVLAVSTGLAAVMNLAKEDRDYAGSDETGA